MVKRIGFGGAIRQLAGVQPPPSPTTEKGAQKIGWA